MGFISQFIPVVGTYIAASVPLLVALLQSPTQAVIFLIFVILYQQVENYLLSPRITARTMQLHPAVAIAAAIAGATLRGPIGAILALPIAAILQAIIGTYLTRHDIIEDDSDLISDDDANKPTKSKHKSSQEA
jgi:predicted PurR-regulated permease PerM